MKNACEKWKEPLRDAALTGSAAKELEEHLRGCGKCSAELDEARARAARLDALLPQVAQGAEPSANFRARVLAAAEARSAAKRPRRWRVWTPAAATAAAVVLLMIAVTWQRRTGRMIPEEEVAAAQKLAEWRAPSDSLLRTPGQELLKTTPKLGNSYLHFPVKMDEEE